jgi:signal transduction histidine kinase
VLRKTPSLAKLIMGTTGSFLVSADAERVNLGRSYQQMRMRVSALGEEKEQLQELLRLREEMEAMLVHDLRNPLNIVQTGITLLDPIIKGEESEETSTTILELMQSSVKRMLRLTDTLLDIAKMEAGKANLDIMEFNLAALVDAIINEQSPNFEEKDIVLKSDMPANLNLQADRDVIYRVITNLVDNAMKFTPDKGLISIMISSVDDKWAKVIVNDSGPGIPEAERERIFEKFTQIKVNAPPKRKGTGLGLTFCRMAIEAHGGKIWIEPGPNNVGASFQFKLPLILTE